MRIDIDGKGGLAHHEALARARGRKNVGRKHLHLPSLRVNEKRRRSIAQRNAIGLLARGGRMLPIRMTPKRRAWLEQLRDHGPAKRGRTNVGYQCMHAGWTEWNYLLADGTPISDTEARERFGSDWWEHIG